MVSNFSLVLVPLLCVSFTTAMQVGWLDQAVQFYKQKFLKDVNDLAPSNFNATLISEPAGYTDSQNWTYDAAVRLLALLRENKHTQPVYRQLRRSLRPQASRRIMMSFQQSLQYFPSLAKKYPNDFYYSSMEGDHSAAEVETAPPPPRRPARPRNETHHSAVVFVTNPVEARLPSARISVRMLKEILTQRALAGKYMSTTSVKPHYVWEVDANEGNSTATTSGPSGVIYRHLQDKASGPGVWYKYVFSGDSGTWYKKKDGSDAWDQLGEAEAAGLKTPNVANYA